MTSESNSTTGRAAPQLGKWWWIPSSVVMLSLLVLLLVPWAIDHRSNGLRLIAAAEKLDAYLTQFVDSQRARLLQVSRLYIIVPAVLAPVAVLAMLLSMWMARRLQLFAALAESERAEVLRAAESRAAL